VQNFAQSQGLKSPYIYTVFIDEKGDLWIGSTGGLSWFQNGTLHTVSSQQGLTSDQIFAIVDDSYDRLWFATFGGIASLEKKSLTDWAEGRRDRLNPTVYRATDDMEINTVGRTFPNAVRSGDGLWFSFADGVTEVMPTNPRGSREQEFPVLIEDVRIDGISHFHQDRVRIPPGTRSIEISYTAINLSNPESVRFRYRLRGLDNDWIDADSRRIAFYNNLKPGTYTFTVSASAGPLRWLEAPPLVIEQLPFFYQTKWFALLVLTTFLSLGILSYRFRMQQVLNRIRASFQERMDERTRIARELHDTLLQSFHGLIFRFQAVDNLLPARPGEAKHTLESALDDAAQAITEARDAVHELRSSTVVTNDLAAAVTALGEELSTHQATSAAGQDSATFLVEVEGTPQELHPILRDEVYRIAGEGLRNAFRHARARRIEVEIRYDERELRVRIRDDGSGIDATVLGHEGRAGHWGLRGMRERAQRIGGMMDLWSEQGAGTEVELRIPASIAYQTYAGRSFRLFRKKTTSL